MLDLPRITVEELDAMSDNLGTLGVAATVDSDLLRRLVAEVRVLSSRLQVEGLPPPSANDRWDRIDELELQLKVARDDVRLAQSDVAAYRRLVGANESKEFDRLRHAAEEAELKQAGAELAREEFRRDADVYRTAVEELTEVATEAMCRIVILEPLHAAVTSFIDANPGHAPGLLTALEACDEKLKQLDYVAPEGEVVEQTAVTP